MPHAFKTNWIYEIPVGRGRRFGGEHERGGSTRVVGNWEFSGTGRVQSERYRHRQRQAGRHDARASCRRTFKIRTVRSDAGTITVFSFPQDIIDNTRRAFNTDPTSATGYGGDGVPTGRYIAPASDAGLHRRLPRRLRRAATGRC